MNTASALIDDAKRATGLEDFGGDGFREGLEILLEAATREAHLTDAGMADLRRQITSLLSSRLKIEFWYARHPEIDEQEIVAPLIGLGLPRTGSSALACLLGEDRNVRFVRTWELISPCPPPEAATQHTDPRIALAQEAMDLRARVSPRMVGMLPTTATSPTECQNFMAYEFKSQVFQSVANVPTYTAWLNNKAEMVSTYRYLRRVLKLLQWRCPPRRWRIKNPSHILFIDALNKVFPDARFVMTHRDVASVLPSVADLYFELQKAHSDHVDMGAIGQVTTEFCELGMRRMIAFRDAGNDHRFFDIHFEPFQANPFSALQELYAFLREELTAETRASMERWRRETASDDQRYERTPMIEFGLNAAEIRKRFRFYTDRFHVALAAAATT